MDGPRVRRIRSSQLVNSSKSIVGQPPRSRVVARTNTLPNGKDVNLMRGSMKSKNAVPNHSQASRTQKSNIFFFGDFSALCFFILLSYVSFILVLILQLRFSFSTSRSRGKTWLCILLPSDFAATLNPFKPSLAFARCSRQ
jgi:hypothetical protein